jgi:hypothetical protein
LWPRALAIDPIDRAITPSVGNVENEPFGRAALDPNGIERLLVLAEIR